MSLKELVPIVHRKRMLEQKPWSQIKEEMNITTPHLYTIRNSPEYTEVFNKTYSQLMTARSQARKEEATT